MSQVQGDESNEICGAAYLLMSEIVARSSNSKHLAVEYALLSLEIRKAVHGD